MLEHSLVLVTHGPLWAGCKKLEEVAAESVVEAATVVLVAMVLPAAATAVFIGLVLAQFTLVT